MFPKPRVPVFLRLGFVAFWTRDEYRVEPPRHPSKHHSEWYEPLKLLLSAPASRNRPATEPGGAVLGQAGMVCPDALTKCETSDYRGNRHRAQSAPLFATYSSNGPGDGCN